MKVILYLTCYKVLAKLCLYILGRLVIIYSVVRFRSNDPVSIMELEESQHNQIQNDYEGLLTIILNVFLPSLSLRPGGMAPLGYHIANPAMTTHKMASSS